MNAVNLLTVLPTPAMLSNAALLAVAVDREYGPGLTTITAPAASSLSREHVPVLDRPEPEPGPWLLEESPMRPISSGSLRPRYPRPATTTPTEGRRSGLLTRGRYQAPGANSLPGPMAAHQQPGLWPDAGASGARTMESDDGARSCAPDCQSGVSLIRSCVADRQATAQPGRPVVIHGFAAIRATSACSAFTGSAF